MISLHLGRFSTKHYNHELFANTEHFFFNCLAWYLIIGIKRWGVKFVTMGITITELIDYLFFNIRAQVALRYSFQQRIRNAQLFQMSCMQLYVRYPLLCKKYFSEIKINNFVSHSEHSL